MIPMKPIKVADKWGFTDQKGEILIQPKFDKISPGIVSATSFPVCLNGKWGYVKSDGFAPVKTDNGWGVVDKKGKIIVQPSYDRIGGIAEDMIVVEKNNLCGYVNSSGEAVTTIHYNFADRFEKGEATVCVKGKFFKINRQGVPICTFEPSLEYILNNLLLLLLLLLHQPINGTFDPGIIKAIDIIYEEYPDLRKINFCISVDLLKGHKGKSGNGDEEALPVIHLYVSEMPLIQYVKFICRSYNARYSILDDDTVIILPVGKLI
jgi:hypothetical protein